MDAMQSLQEVLEELKAYKALGTVEELREMKCNSLIAKSSKSLNEYTCPNCKRRLMVSKYEKYCEICSGMIFPELSKGKEQP